MSYCVLFRLGGGRPVSNPVSFGLRYLFSMQQVLAIIGEQFEDNDEICGAVVSGKRLKNTGASREVLGSYAYRFKQLTPEECHDAVRANGDIISIWNRSAENSDATNRICDFIRTLWKVPYYVNVDYKVHNPSLVTKAPSVWRRCVKQEAASGAAHGKRPHG